MITAVEAKQIQTNYLTSQCDIDRYMADVEEAIKECAEHGGNSIYFDFDCYDLAHTFRWFAKKTVKEHLNRFGYTVLDGQLPSELYIHW